MKTEGKKCNNTEALSVEPGPVNGVQFHDYDFSWQQVGLMMVTSFNCGYILSFSNLMLVPLGWAWGIICLIIVGLFTAYANSLLAGFHYISGDRFVRYRDLMGYLYGREMYYITSVFQFSTHLLGNMGFILLGGRALKEIDSEYILFSNSPLRLQYFIIVTGATYFIFAFLVRTMSGMRSLLGASTMLTISYIGTLLVVLVKDGISNPNRDFEISGSKLGKVFNACGAISATIVCNTSGKLLEIESTLRKPVVKNMRKALFLQYSVGLIFYYGVSIVGYWAYGSMVSEYLPKELSGPKRVKLLINCAVFLQSIISQHMFVAPLHEALDSKFLKLDKSMNSKENLIRLFFLRALLFTGNTFVTAALPFMGNFVNLFGSFTLIPLTFIFPSMIFVKIKGKKVGILKKAWHWANIVLHSVLAVVSTISAVRSIINNVRDYHFFADT